MHRPSRRRPTRIPGYDYAAAGAYFVTICTRGKECIFGEVKGEVVALSREGRIAAECWLDIPRHFPGVGLDEWVVMPNHVHGILLIGGRGEAFARAPGKDEDHQANASPLRVLRASGTKRGSLGAIIQNFKSVSSRRANEDSGPSRRGLWQRNYYEHVIRTENDLARIREYIIENPLRWELDEENPRRGERGPV